ncbi:hypothetical protein [Consotaella aegiceratis]|uniref:hypothetical protein n=1 Tax=Consotaella aegiceratis TaxID=3097961 RepID=UPI002F40CCC1
MKIGAIITAGAVLAAATSAASAGTLFNTSSNGYTLLNVQHAASFKDDDALYTTGVFGPAPTAAALQKTIDANPGLAQAFQAQDVDLSSLQSISVLPGHVVAYRN